MSSASAAILQSSARAIRAQVTAMPMKQTKAAKRRAVAPYVDGDKERFEARLHKNARSPEPHVPAMTATKGKRNRFTGMTTKGTVQAVKKERAGPVKKKTG